MTRFLPAGFPVVLSSPSGGGKSTAAAGVLDRLPFVKRSRSLTTRPIRVGEVDGRDYDFVTEAEFERRKAAGAFVETAWVHGHRYGTTLEFVESVCRAGDCPLLVIDVQGGLAMKRYDPRTVLVFLMPPSLTEVEQRLRDRHTESREDLEMRLRNARGEIAESAKYDYIVVNDELALAVEQVCRVLTHEREMRQG